jgi:hypothetical protein
MALPATGQGKLCGLFSCLSPVRCEPDACVREAARVAGPGPAQPHDAHIFRYWLWWCEEAGPTALQQRPSNCGGQGLRSSAPPELCGPTFQVPKPTPMSKA